MLKSPPWQTPRNLIFLNTFITKSQNRAFQCACAHAAKHAPSRAIQPGQASAKGCMPCVGKKWCEQSNRCLVKQERFDVTKFSVSEFDKSMKVGWGISLPTGMFCVKEKSAGVSCRAVAAYG